MARPAPASGALACVLLTCWLLVAAAEVAVPCDIHGRWNSLQSEFQSDTVARVSCSLSGKHIVAGPGGLLTAGEVCPTAEQRGEPPVTPTPYLQVTYNVQSVPVPVTRTPAGSVNSEGCVCFYMVSTALGCAAVRVSRPQRRGCDVGLCLACAHACPSCWHRVRSTRSRVGLTCMSRACVWLAVCVCVCARPPRTMRTSTRNCSKARTFSATSSRPCA